ncbi:MAG TPA: ATP-binding protein [Lysobacter sp.]
MSWAVRRALAILISWMALCALAFPASADGQQPLTEIARAEAVRADWNSETPPATEWTPVRLPDAWDARWPRHDGVAWYRVRWNQADASRPVGLMIDYVHLASAVYVNGALLARDARLVEPLSRGWIRPQYFLLGAPLLREGENVLLVRVSGLAAYEPGLGEVTVGDPEIVQARFDTDVFRRFDIKLINLAINAVLGTIFLLMWMFRRKETTFGWFALYELAYTLGQYNLIVEDPWPFASTDGWQAFVGAMGLVSVVSWAMFLLRYGERRYSRLEKAMGIVCALLLAVALLGPQWIGVHRPVAAQVASLVSLASIAWFMGRAWRVPRTDFRVLAAFLVVPLLAASYDLVRWFGLLPGTHLLRVASVVTSLGVMCALAYRFVAAMHRIEEFNVELQREVDAATQELGRTLAREHALALAKSRAEERLQLTRDLHDGFGGTLLGTIAQLEQTPDATSRTQVVEVLRGMRDDLRLVIESTTRERADLIELLAPLRHRSGQLLEAAGIDSYWHMSGVEGIELDGARNLDLLRLLQEALTNAFKHSRASRVDVHLARADEQLHLRVQDDGRGLAGAAPAFGGAGLASMRLRAQRLGGRLQVESSGDGTLLQVTIPLLAAAFRSRQK